MILCLTKCPNRPASPGLKPWAEKPSFLLSHFSQLCVIATRQPIRFFSTGDEVSLTVCPSVGLNTSDLNSLVPGIDNKEFLLLHWLRDPRKYSKVWKTVKTSHKTSVLLTLAVNFTHPRVPQEVSLNYEIAQGKWPVHMSGGNWLHCPVYCGQHHPLGRWPLTI